MSKSKHPHLHSRKFLNRNKGSALIETNFSISSHSFGGDIKISDCNRTINLDFYSYDSKTYQDHLYKMHLLVDEVTKARDFMVKNMEYFLALNKEFKAKEKKTKYRTTTFEEIMGSLEEPDE